MVRSPVKLVVAGEDTGAHAPAPPCMLSPGCPRRTLTRHPRPGSVSFTLLPLVHTLVGTLSESEKAREKHRR